MTSNPPKPLVYFSYGLTKSASTLAYRLAWLSLEDAGFTQPRVPPPVVEEIHSVNFVTHVSESMMAELTRIARAQGYPLVVKTHVLPSPAVIEAVNSGQAKGSITFRDPRDMALSMLDHGAKARRKGDFAFREYGKLPDTLDAIRLQVDALTQWMRLPDMLPLTYDQVAFDTKNTVKKLQQHLGITGNPAKIARMVSDKRYIQFNKGIRDRHKREMSADDSAAFAREFAPLIETLARVQTTPFDGRPVLDATASLRH